MNKTISAVKDDISDILDNTIIDICDFFAAGIPGALIEGLIEKGIKDLTI